MASRPAALKENAAPSGAAPAGRQLAPGELKAMLSQCLKMASENKITGQNTWGLPLIEHLDDLVREDAPGQHTNFQRASVTLEAGMKIYGYRVDSIHTETFKILGGLGRASGPGQEADADQDPGEGGAGGSPSKRARRGGLNPEATLEPTLEALNVKKYDMAFAVDPLFHKTSAQFDEGGARGLLLNNLSVYRACEIVFDSADVPEDAADEGAAVAAADARISLEGVAPQVAALADLRGDERISPALDDILALMGAAPAAGAAAQADDFVRRVAAAAGDVRPWEPPAAAEAAAPAERAAPAAEGGAEGGPEAAAAAEAYAAEAYGEDDDAGGDYGGYDEGGGGYDDFSEGEEGPGPAARRASLAAGAGPGGASLGEDAISWLIAAGADSSSGHVTGAKGWAGASHWRYRAAPAAAGEEAEGGGAGRGRKKAGGPRRKNEPLDFVALMVEGAAPPEFELLPRGAGRRGARRPRPAAKTLLPEDQHYKAESLARYALRPRSAVALPGSGAAPRGDRTYLEDGDFADGGFADMGGGFDDGGGSDDDGGGGGGEYGGEGGGGGWDFAPGGVGDALELVEAARRVDKVEVTYARAAKQVDVRCLKELMWAGIQAVLAARGATGAGGNAQAGAQAPIEFAEVLASVPAVNAAGRVEDLSVHLCFICVLHLANEHGLAVAGVGGLDRMLVSNVPVAAA